MSAPAPRPSSPPPSPFTAQDWGFVCLSGFAVGLAIGKVIDLAIGGPGLLAAFGIVG